MLNIRAGLVVALGLLLLMPGIAMAQNRNVQHSDRVEAGDGVTRTDTRFGTVTVVSKAEMDDDDISRTPVMLGRQTLKLEGYGGAVESHFVLSDQDLLVITTTVGARGVPPNYYLIRVDRSGLKDVSAGTDFGTADYTYRAEQNGDTVSFDLGFEDRWRKTAIYRNGELQVAVTKVAANTRLSKDDCAFVLNAVAECKAAGECSNPTDDFAMFYVRGLATLENNPAFSRAAFDRQCQVICRTSNYSVAPVRKELCGY